MTLVKEVCCGGGASGGCSARRTLLHLLGPPREGRVLVKEKGRHTCTSIALGTEGAQAGCGSLEGEGELGCLCVARLDPLLPGLIPFCLSRFLFPLYSG